MIRMMQCRTTIKETTVRSKMNTVVGGAQKVSVYDQMMLQKLQLKKQRN